MDKPNKEAQKITGNEDVHNEAEQAKAAQSKKIATKKAEQAKAKTADKTPDGAKEATGALRQPINRGSKRRAVLAIETFDKAFKKFNEEMDKLFYQAADDGKRLGSWEMIEHLEQTRSGINHECNVIMHPEQAE